MAAVPGLSILGFLGALLAYPVVSAAASPLLTKVETTARGAWPTTPLTPQEATEAHRRGRMAADRWLSELAAHGLDPERATALFAVGQSQIADAMLIDALRRKIIGADTFAERMKARGWDDADVSILVKVTEFYPSAQDLISWQAHEVYEGDKVAQFGLDAEFGNLDLEPFEKGGIDAEQARNYWIAHWQHPSWTQIQRFLHWELIGERDLESWFSLVEIPPFWRQKFIDTAYNSLTRVDVRRMWDLGVLNDAEVVRAYKRAGYNAEDAEALLVFTKMERSLPELRQRYKNGWITEERVRQELTLIGLQPDKLQRVVEALVKNDKPERVQKERDLTKAEIQAGYKKGILVREQAERMLQAMGYDVDEADFLLALKELNVPGSPETPLEHEWLVAAYRKAIGKSAFVIPAELLALERESLAAVAALEAGRQQGADGEELADLIAKDANVRYRWELAYKRWQADNGLAG